MQKSPEYFLIVNEIHNIIQFLFLNLKIVLFGSDLPKYCLKR